jgi:hypothetical protein
MRRREFIKLLGGAAAGWPLAARTEQPTMPLVGLMSARSPRDSIHLVAAFRQGMSEGGFVEGRNVAVEYRWANGEYDRLPALAADLVNRNVAVLQCPLLTRSRHRSRPYGIFRPFQCSSVSRYDVRVSTWREK